MSRDEIQRDIERRNTLRAQAQLPLLDVAGEFRAQVAIQDQADSLVAWQAYAGTRAAIRREVLAARRLTCPSFPNNSFGTWALELEVNDIFGRYLRERGLPHPWGSSGSLFRRFRSAD